MGDGTAAAKRNPTRHRAEILNGNLVMLVGSGGRRAVLGTPVGIGERNKRVKRVEILKGRLFDGWIKLDTAFETRIAPRREVSAVVEGTLKAVASTR